MAHFVCAVVVLMAWQTNLAGSRIGRQEKTRSEVLAECKEHDIKNAESVGIKLYLEQTNLGGLAPEELEVLELVQQLSGPPAPGK